MTRPILLALVAIALPFGAAHADRFNRGVDSVHQPVVQRSDYVFDVPGNGLDPAEGTRVHQWFDAIGLAYGDRISIDGSASGTGSNRDIAAIVGDYGLFVSPGAPVTEGAIAPGYARIVVSRSTATVSGCPDYSQASQPNFTAAASSNYGCAINSTLAAMVANPEDLVRGREAGPPNADTAAKAIKVWRNADPTSKAGLKLEATKGGN
ncbi:CpaD family pilus assembly protein [Sphingomonas sp. SRS2]|uniref:CpaD family pilus assembly protein n=1 Tax=Sphingomonas sp. SRS2 TaxID=133190 RepID=UPI000A81E10E|nr:CpaD family pilus assembly lipoprotein [Sphingomonas sp. SRS2]